jgi:hypothetical protein
VEAAFALRHNRNHLHDPFRRKVDWYSREEDDLEFILLKVPLQARTEVRDTER